MKDHLNPQFDPEFNPLLKTRVLSWYPWVGRRYSPALPHRLLLVGESCYFKGNLEAQPHFGSADFTRLEIVNCAIKRHDKNHGWRPSKTIDNIRRILCGSNTADATKFWELVAFHNFIQRPLPHRARPTPDEFRKSWNSFLEVAGILKPTLCIFIGVTASHSFSAAMEEEQIEFTPVKWHEKIGSTYPRSASVTLAGGRLPIVSVKHAGARLSWSAWNKFAISECGDAVKFMCKEVN